MVIIIWRKQYPIHTKLYKNQIRIIIMNKQLFTIK